MSGSMSPEELERWHLRNDLKNCRAELERATAFAAEADRLRRERDDLHDLVAREQEWRRAAERNVVALRAEVERLTRDNKHLRKCLFVADAAKCARYQHDEGAGFHVEGTALDGKKRE